MVGGALAAGASGAFNCYIDRDIDKHMQRTKNRPLVTGEVTPRETLVFSWVLTFLAIGILAVGRTGWLPPLVSPRFSSMWSSTRSSSSAVPSRTSFGAV